ncbi:hypothetical protein EVAR_66910_1 [Eumeta japonica]|uniref:Uncharacterized protein n=1 Tax=Eumeta variegata TaxID=151549 RepID=A0A4C1Z756_EUMVA|nr:hypothetical protein EVAR_66910_1 [Eumeta japonica]
MILSQIAVTIDENQFEEQTKDSKNADEAAAMRTAAPISDVDLTDAWTSRQILTQRDWTRDRKKSPHPEAGRARFPRVPRRGADKRNLLPRLTKVLSSIVWVPCQSGGAAPQATLQTLTVSSRL